MKLTSGAVKTRNTEDIDVAALWGVDARTDTGLTCLEAGRDGNGASNKAEKRDK
jgi:hypothetical protein